MRKQFPSPRRIRLAVSRWIHLQMKQRIFHRRWRGVSFRIEDAGEFRGIFRPGEKVMELHFFSADPRSLVLSMRETLDAIPRLRGKGFVGFYGDTPNEAIIRFWRRHGAEITESPAHSRRAARRFYESMMKEEGFSPKYADTAIRRILFRFPGA